MPKGKVDETVGGRRVRKIIRRANKIGGRKMTRGVAQMTAEDLRKIVTGNRGRDAQKARNELVKRGLPIEVVVAETA